MTKVVPIGRFTQFVQESGFCVARIPEKSKSGIATPKPDMDIIHERLKVAERITEHVEAFANMPIYIGGISIWNWN